jgi:uncharacterized protein YndB with AHSA1/START domain
MTLESDRVIVIARAFNGPARIVFEAVTKADLVRRWWAPTSLGDSGVSFEADVRVGGKYRYVIRSSQGNAVAFSGRYTEVAPPTRLVYTQHFEPTASGPMPGAEELIVTVTFDERGGKTHMVQHILCPSKDVRDVILASGMEHGMRITMDQLDELVASLASEEAKTK